MLPLEWKRAARTDLWAILDYIDDTPEAAQPLKNELAATVAKLPPKSANVPCGARSRYTRYRLTSFLKFLPVVPAAKPFHSLIIQHKALDHVLLETLCS